VNGGDYRPVRCRKHLAAVLRKPKFRTQEILCSGRAETNDEVRLDSCDLRFEPRAASRDFERVRLLMQPDFAPRFPFEVLHGIGYVNHGPIDTGCLQALIKQLTSRPHKWLSLLIFAITRLFAHEKYRGVCWPLAKYHLRRALVQIASVALLGCVAQAGEIVARW
jgi:hypothetical protein